MIAKVSLIAVLFHLCLTYVATGEIFVNPVVGKDNNSGECEAPLRDFRAAMAKAGPGDIIRMMPVDVPVHSSFVVHGKSGMPERPVTIDGGFNIYDNCRNIIFENVASLHDGDDRISAHGSNEIAVRDYVSIGNATGICHIDDSKGVHENVYIAETKGHDLFLVNRKNVFREVAAESQAPGGIEFPSNNIDEGAASNLQAPYPESISSWDDTIKNAQREDGRKLLSNLDIAIKNGDKKFVAEKGDYRFGETKPVPGGHMAHIVLEGISDLTIDFNGSTLWFERHAYAFNLTRCRNLSIKNVNMDWNPLPYTQGHILEIDNANNILKVKLDHGYSLVTPEFSHMPEGAHLPPIAGYTFNPETKRFVPGMPYFRVLPFFGQNPDDDIYNLNVFVGYGLSLEKLPIQKGDLITLNLRGGGCFLSAHCSDLLFEDITIYSCPSFAFNECAGNGGNVYRRCNILLRPGTNRLLACNADAFHSTFQERGPVLENCKAQSVADDFLNVNNCIGNIIEQKSSNSLFTDSVAWRPVEMLRSSLTFAFFASEDLTLLGKRKTIGFEKISDYRYLVKLDSSITLPPKAFYLVEEYSAAGTIVRGCTFVNGKFRGLLLQSADSLVEDNTFEWLLGPAISLQPEFEYWKNGTHTRHSRIINNRIADTCLGYAAKPWGAIDIETPGNLDTTRWQKNIFIENNTIENSGYSAIRIHGAEGVAIRHNTIYGHGQRLFLGGHEDSEIAEPCKTNNVSAIVLEHVKDGVCEHNTIEKPGIHGTPFNP